MAPQAADGTLDEAIGAGGSGKMGLILALILCLVGATCGFFGVSLGYVPLNVNEDVNKPPVTKADPAPDIAFVQIPPLIVTLPPGAENKHLRFSGMIEVPAEFAEDIEFLMPRILDFMNGYLRALKAEEIEGPGSIFRIRMHLYRRIVSVVGLGKTNGLLITEFILK